VLQEARRRALVDILDLLQDKLKDDPPTMIESVTREVGRSPFVVLISCLLSLRARDAAVLPVAVELLKSARTPEDLLGIPVLQLQKLLRPIGFFVKKAAVVREVARILLNQFEGLVPSDRVQLLGLPGVGPKTTSLVLSEAFEIPAICVDTHVARLSRLFGLVDSSEPVCIENELMEICARERWREINSLFVRYGQGWCFFWSKGCSSCKDASLCYVLQGRVHAWSHALSSVCK